MLSGVWLIPALPLAGFLALALGGRRLPRAAVAALGVGAVGLAALVAIAVAVRFSALPSGAQYTQALWTWIETDGFRPRIAFHLDSLSMVMTLVVSVVGFLILLYSAEFMAGDEGYGRFFAYMDLFVAAMLTLVLADNLLLLYLGWEGVGLCSFLLIGFWYRDAGNVRAARKAFIVTRVGDAAFLVGLALLFTSLGTLDIQEVLARAAGRWPAGAGMATAAALLLLGGAVGKSAQLPLHVWLPDAMAGPTPVSALIHAATMVTAGVYLLARTQALFALAPAVQLVAAVIGAATLLLAAGSALVERDVKRMLAYSTMSQVGYMFLALGAGAWAAAVFHLMTHAFFKSLLFLSAGVIILARGHETDMFKMGGRRGQPWAFWTFLIGAASLSALPLVTAGFYSKELILAQVWAHAPLGRALWVAGLAGALLTALYSFRAFFILFFGAPSPSPAEAPAPVRWTMAVPLVALSALSILGGFVRLPGLERTPGARMLMLTASLASLAGLFAAYLFYRRRAPAPGVGLVRRFWLAGWGFDALYDRLFVRPYLRLARAYPEDLFDALGVLAAYGVAVFHFLLRFTQTGRVRWYAMAVALGAILAVAIAVFA